MIDKPLNQLNEFFNLTQERTICGSDQLLYLHLFNRFNRSHWTQSMSIPDRELITAMRLYEGTGKPATVHTLYRSRSRLQSAGLIKFKPGKGSDCTEYELIQLYPVDTPADTPVDTPADTPVDTPADTPVASADINARAKDGKDVKDVKTLKKERERAREERRSIVPFDNNTNNIAVQDMWFRCEDEVIPGGVAMGLVVYEKKYGVELVCEAIKNASQSNSYQRLSLKWVIKKLDELLEGSKKNARNDAAKRVADDEDWEHRRATFLD